MGAHIGFSESPFLPGAYVEPRAVEQLIATGWQPPPEVHQVHRSSQDPTPGPFLLPKEATVKHIERLTRYEADLVLRQLTGRYYDRYEVDNGPRFDDFAGKLAWQIGADNTVDFRDYLEEALIDLDGMAAVYGSGLPSEHREQYESNFNASVNNALSAANIPGEYTRYYTAPVPA